MNHKSVTKVQKIPKRLGQEPIIEVIWQVQFESDSQSSIGDLLPGLLYSELKKQHPALQLQRLPAAAIPAPVAQHDPNLRFTAKYRLFDSSSPFLYQVGDCMITMNCRRPYAGWSVFKDKLLRLIDIIESGGVLPVPLGHSLRYIDLITLNQASDLSILQLNLGIGKWNGINYPLQMRIDIPDGDLTQIIQIATPAEANLPEGLLKGTVIDLETLKTKAPKKKHPKIGMMFEHRLIYYTRVSKQFFLSSY
jgi:uncharacterized protein (TIGR04255 family)